MPPKREAFLLSLIIRITFVVERLDVGIVTRIHFRNLILDKFLVVIAANGSSVHQQVGILDSRNNDAEDADAHAYTLRMDVVDNACCLQEGVRINLQLVQLLVGFP